MVGSLGQSGTTLEPRRWFARRSSQPPTTCGSHPSCKMRPDDHVTCCFCFQKRVSRLGLGLFSRYQDSHCRQVQRIHFTLSQAYPPNLHDQTCDSGRTLRTSHDIFGFMPNLDTICSLILQTRPELFKLPV